MSAPSTEQGFTVVELIAVLVLVGLLAAVALPRMNLMATLRGDSWRDQVVAGLRLAQSTALGHRRLVCASFNGGHLELQIAASAGATSCSAALRGPDGSNRFTDSIPNGAVTVSPAGTLYFQPSGRVSEDGAGNTVSSRSISAAGVPSISVQGQSGHAE